MTALSLALAAASVALFIRPPTRVVLARRLVGAAPDPVRRPRYDRRRAAAATLVVTVVALSLVAAIGGGSPISVVTVAVLMVLGTAARIGLQRRRAVQARKLRTEVAHACEVLAAQLAIGRVPTEALSAAAEDCPVLSAAEGARRVGGDVVASWREAAGRPGTAGLADLARAWEVSTMTGAPMARSLRQVAEALAADQALAQVVDAELAAPRATGRMMAVLPLLGIGLGYVIGGDPLGFLLDEPVGWVCLLLGTALACAGVLWIERLADGAGERW